MLSWPPQPPSPIGRDSPEIDAPLGAEATLLASAEAEFAHPRSGLSASAAVGQEILLAALRALGDRLAHELGRTSASPRDTADRGESPVSDPASTLHTAPGLTPRQVGTFGAGRPNLPSSVPSNLPSGPPDVPRTRPGRAHSAPSVSWTEIHLLLVGGAAGMLSGLLDPERTTTDCDVMLYHPVDAGEFVEQLASDLAGEFGLSERWLNRGGAPWAEAMPAGWEERSVPVLSHGPLRVHAVGRLDLIALKLVAGRVQDIEDLETMAITSDEVSSLRRHFEEWSDDSWPSGVIAGARELLEILAESASPPNGEGQP